jgi:hypothetical protein
MPLWRATCVRATTAIHVHVRLNPRWRKPGILRTSAFVNRELQAGRPQRRRSGDSLARKLMKSRLCFRVDAGLRGWEETPEFVTEPVDVVVSEWAGAAGEFGVRPKPPCRPSWVMPKRLAVARAPAVWRWRPTPACRSNHHSRQSAGRLIYDPAEGDRGARHGLDTRSE